MTRKTLSCLPLRAFLVFVFVLSCASCQAGAQQTRPAASRTAGLSGPGAKRPAKHKEYDEILRESDVVILGQVDDAQIIQLKNEAGPLPEPKRSVNQEGIPVTIMPAGSSWFLADLFDPPRLWCYRAQVRIVEPFFGSFNKDSRITVDLVYGISRELVEEFVIGAAYTRVRSAKGSLVILHLRKTEVTPGGVERAPYELVSEQPPWPVDKDELTQRVADMKIRMRRYEALQEIDKLIAKVENLSNADRKTLRELVAASRPGLGQPRWTHRERVHLDQVLAGAVPGQTSAQAWRSWWSAHRDTFINAPFRIGAGLGSQPSPETRPG